MPRAEVRGGCFPSPKPSLCTGDRSGSVSTQINLRYRPGACRETPVARVQALPLPQDRCSSTLLLFLSSRQRDLMVWALSGCFGSAAVAPSPPAPSDVPTLGQAGSGLGWFWLHTCFCGVLNCGFWGWGCVSLRGMITSARASATGLSILPQPDGCCPT